MTGARNAKVTKVTSHKPEFVPTGGGRRVGRPWPVDSKRLRTEDGTRWVGCQTSSSHRPFLHCREVKGRGRQRQLVSYHRVVEEVRGSACFRSLTWPLQERRGEAKDPRGFMMTAENRSGSQVPTKTGAFDGGVGRREGRCPGERRGTVNHRGVGVCSDLTSSFTCSI